MKKRLFTLLALLVLLPVMAFATEVVITWEWMLDDPQVTGFRYQLNGEDPDSWEIVDGMTSSAVIENLDGTIEHTLYLQQTYDGINWSPSAISTAPALVEEEPMVEAEAVEEVEAEVVEPEIIAEETQDAEVVEEAEEEVQEEVIVAKADKKKKPYYTSISVSGAGIYTFNPVVAAGAVESYDNLNANVGVGVGLNNLLTLGSIGLGLNVNVDAMLVPLLNNARASLTSFFTDSSITRRSLRLTLAPKAEMEFGKFIVNVAGLVDATLVDVSKFGTIKITPDLGSNIAIGYGGQVGLAYQFNNLIQLGADAKVRRYAGSQGEWGVEVTPAMRFTF